MPVIELILLITMLVFAVVFHECAHGWTAHQLGDPTAKLLGRLTLNPIKHVDLVGTILLPGALIILNMMGKSVPIFGWAKPVPVNFAALRNPRRDMILVALAGPISNIIFAIVLAFILQLQLFPLLNGVLITGVFINLLLAIFNMFPVPPLDGSRVVMGILPRDLAVAYARIERFGILIVFGLLYLGVFDYVVVPVIARLGALLGVSFS